MSDNSRWARHLFTAHCEHQISMVQQSGTGWDNVPQMKVLSDSVFDSMIPGAVFRPF